MIQQELILKHIWVVCSKMNQKQLGCMRDALRNIELFIFLRILTILVTKSTFPSVSKCFQESNIFQPLIPNWCQSLCTVPGQLFSQVISQLVQGWLGIGSVLVLNTK